MTGLGGSADPPWAVVHRTEQRMSRMIGYARAACATFVVIPLFGWDRLRHPWLAVLIVVAATAEASWFAWRAWHGPDRLSRRLVLTDVTFCVALMLVGSRAAQPHERNKLMTELVPFSLVASAGVGFGLGLGLLAAAAVAILMTAWSLAVLPDVSLKLGSDLLGFTLWYIVAMLIARELRTLSAATATAQDAAKAAGRVAVEQEREAESLRQREITHREIHDYLLPIVDHVAAGGTPSPALVREARRGAQRARRIIMDPRGLDPRVLDGNGNGNGNGGGGGGGTPAPGETGFEAMMSTVVDAFADEGLALVPFVAIQGEPPAPVREALVAATREALRNVVRHAGGVDEVSLFVEGDAGAVLVVVRDRGVGFDPTTVRPGGGMSGSYQAVRRHGGQVVVTAQPGGGVKVTLRWPAPPTP
ncbi:sensor histidine kinase, partial [Frankia gtarii]|uniref:sensor histidine kinase n=1 Tax=Frankia gtarii TaxID=2950102 RepID=UPI0021BE335B